jgi:hypothetical protein
MGLCIVVLTDDESQVLVADIVLLDVRNFGSDGAQWSRCSSSGCGVVIKRGDVCGDD